MNAWISEKGVCWTAPTTPGLLNMYSILPNIIISKVNHNGLANKRKNWSLDLFKLWKCLLLRKLSNFPFLIYSVQYNNTNKRTIFINLRINWNKRTCLAKNFLILCILIKQINSHVQIIFVNPYPPKFQQKLFSYFEPEFGA